MSLAKQQEGKVLKWLCICFCLLLPPPLHFIFSPSRGWAQYRIWREMQIKLGIRLLPYLELAPHSFKLQRKETLINKNKLIGFLICIRVEVNVKIIIFFGQIWQQEHGWKFIWFAFCNFAKKSIVPLISLYLLCSGGNKSEHKCMQMTWWHV